MPDRINRHARRTSPRAARRRFGILGRGSGQNFAFSRPRLSGVATAADQRSGDTLVADTVISGPTAQNATCRPQPAGPTTGPDDSSAELATARIQPAAVPAVRAAATGPEQPSGLSSLMGRPATTRRPTGSRSNTVSSRSSTVSTRSTVSSIRSSPANQQPGQYQPGQYRIRASIPSSRACNTGPTRSRAPKSRRSVRWRSSAPWWGVLAAIIVAVVLVLILKPGFFVTTKLDVAKAQQGVQQILTTDETSVHGAKNVKDVKCNNGQSPTVKKGATFTCEVSIDGTKRQVTVTFQDDKGTYEVGRPK